MIDEKQIPSRIPQLLVILAFFAAILSLLILFRRGICITDEGLYLLSSKNPQDALASVTSAFYFIHFLFKLVNFDVFNFRVIGMLMLISSGMLAGWTFYKATCPTVSFKTSRITEFAFSAFGGVGAAVYYIWGIYSPGYNALIAFVTNLSAAFVSFFYYQIKSSNYSIRLTRVTAFLWGLAIGLGFFSKITSSIGLFFITLFWIFVTAPSKRIALQNFIFFLFGLASVFLCFFIFMENIHLWVRHFFYNGWAVISIMGGPSKSFFERHYEEFVNSVIVIFSAYKWEISVLVATGFLIRFKRDNHNAFLYVIIFLITLICILVHSYIAHCFFGGFYNLMASYAFFLFWIILIILGFLINTVSRWLGATFSDNFNLEYKDKGKRWVFLFILFILPYVGAFGTGNPIQRNVVMNVAPWFCLHLLFWTNIYTFWPRFISGIIPVLISVAAVCQIITAPIISPYGLYVNILAQSEPLFVGSSTSRILVDKPTADFFTRLKQITAAAGFKPGDNLLAFTDMSGIVFVLGGRSPGIPWYMGKYMVLYHNKEYNEFGLSLLPRETIAKSLILQKIDDLSGMPNLRKFNINFPHDYSMVGQLIWPATKEIVRVWKPKNNQLQP